MSVQLHYMLYWSSKTLYSFIFTKQLFAKISDLGKAFDYHSLTYLLSITDFSTTRENYFNDDFNI